MEPLLWNLIEQSIPIQNWLLIAYFEENNKRKNIQLLNDQKPIKPSVFSFIFALLVAYKFNLNLNVCLWVCCGWFQFSFVFT